MNTQAKKRRILAPTGLWLVALMSAPVSASTNSTHEHNREGCAQSCTTDSAFLLTSAVTVPSTPKAQVAQPTKSQRAQRKDSPPTDSKGTKMQQSSPDELLAYQASLSNQQDQPGALNAAGVPAGRYQVDPAHTHASWVVNHMGFSLLEGMFGAVDGSIAIDFARLQESKVEVGFDVSDLSVTTSAFADHLKSADLFDVARFPRAQFVSTKIAPTGPHRAIVTGDLTIKGITKPVTLDAAFIGAGTNPMSGKLNFGFAATAIIKRSEFDLGFIVPVVSDNVKLRINAAFAAE